MNYGYVAATVALGVSAGAAAWFLRHGRERLGFALLVASPVVAAGALAGVAHLASTSADAAAIAASSPHAAMEPGTAPGGAASGTPSVGGAGPAMPTPLDGVRTRAAQLRIARRFEEARAAYTELTQLAPDDPDAWADLADASAAAANGDLEKGAAALTKALALAPDHLKALWLQASLELQRRRYAEAAGLWEKLLMLVPAGSNDARIVAANLDEARALQRGER